MFILASGPNINTKNFSTVHSHSAWLCCERKINGRKVSKLLACHWHTWRMIDDRTPSPFISTNFFRQFLCYYCCLTLAQLFILVFYAYVASRPDIHAMMTCSLFGTLITVQTPNTLDHRLRQTDGNCKEVGTISVNPMNSLLFQRASAIKYTHEHDIHLSPKRT